MADVVMIVAAAAISVVAVAIAIGTAVVIAIVATVTVATVTEITVTEDGMRAVPPTATAPRRTVTRAPAGQHLVSKTASKSHAPNNQTLHSIERDGRLPVPFFVSKYTRIRPIVITER